MAKRSGQRSGQARGPRGLRGRRGPAGIPAGDSKLVTDLAAVVAHVTQELEDVQRTLRVQFTRIAQLQTALDNLRVALERTPTASP